MIIRNAMIFQEKVVLTEMLNNWEVILAWDFTKIGKVKREVALPQKIETMKHKAWQVSGLQILKTLSSIVIDMLQKTVKIGVIETCYSRY